MKINPVIKTVIVSFAALGIKFLFPIMLTNFASEKEFSFLIVTFNLILTFGFIFNLEHFTFYHRKAIHKNNPKKIDFLERIYFDKTLLIKLIIIFFVLLFFKDLTIFQRIGIFLISFFDLHLVENLRKFISKGDFLKGSIINYSRVSFPIIIFFIIFLLTKQLNLDILIISILIAFIIIKYIHNIRISKIRNLRINKDLFIKLSYRTWQYAFISIFSTFTPFLDKLILLNFEQFKMIQTITVWSIIGNLISLFIYETINKPRQIELINRIKNTLLDKIIKNIILSKIILLGLFFCTLYIFKFPFDSILKPSIDFNIYQIFSCIILTSCNPINGLLDMSIYGYKKDNLVLISTFIEFGIRYITTITVVLFFDIKFLPYSLALSNLCYLTLKYFFYKRFLDKNFSKYNFLK